MVSLDSDSSSDGDFTNFELGARKTKEKVIRFTYCQDLLRIAGGIY